MSKAKPVEQREHRIRPKLVDISAYKEREIPKLKGRYLKTRNCGGKTSGTVILLVP